MGTGCQPGAEVAIVQLCPGHTTQERRRGQAAAQELHVSRRSVHDDHSILEAKCGEARGQLGQIDLRRRQRGWHEGSMEQTGERG